MHSIDTLVPPKADNSANVEVETNMEMVNKITAKLEETTNALHDVANTLASANSDSDGEPDDDNSKSNESESEEE